MSMICEPKEKIDDMPLGTILTVPKSVTRKGYIDYEEGKQFSKRMYPELYSVLGTDRFSFIGTESNSFPVGTCLFYMSDAIVPTGYVEWNDRYGALREYPALKRVLWNMANRIKDLNVRNTWLEALNRESFPKFNHFYFGLGEVGLMKESQVKEMKFNSAPLVVDHSNTLNPLGVRRCAVHKDLMPVIVGKDVTTASQTLNTSYVVVGQSVDMYQFQSAMFLEHTLGDVGAKDTYPRTLFTRVIVKAVEPETSNISFTHKRIIKAFSEV